MTEETKQKMEEIKKKIDIYLADPDFTLPQKFENLREQLVHLTDAAEGMQITREYLKDKIGIMGANLQRIEIERLTDD